jgi:tRNA threonylcarbamoyladenosine biosynthesis protein TsaE
MKILSRSVQETINIGKAIASRLKGQDIICLFGEFGSGKTVLTKGIAERLGVRKSQVISPSFVIIRQHLEGRLPLYHFDLYRLKDAQDIFNLGYEEYLYGDGVSVIEWAEKLNGLLPAEYLRVELCVGGKEERRIVLSAFGPRYEKLLHEVGSLIKKKR